MRKNIFTIVSVFVLVLLFSFGVQLVRANEDLIIGNDGYVTLIINNNGVLGVTTSAKEEEKSKPVQNTEHSSPPPNQQPQAPVKTEPLVAPHTESIVHIDPPINNEKKVQIIITKNAVQQSGNVQTQNAGANAASQLPAKANAGQQTTTVAKAVDEVVAQGTNGQVVLRIKSEKANQLTVEQGTTHVTTALPLQIDTLTNSLSVTPRVSSALPVLVLPSEAMQGIIDKGFLNTKSANLAKIDLTKDTNGINYTVSSQKQGKLFGIFPVQSPVQVKLSAQNGKVVQASQSVLFSIFGTFIR